MASGIWLAAAKRKAMEAKWRNENGVSMRKKAKKKYRNNGENENRNGVIMAKSVMAKMWRQPGKSYHRETKIAGEMAAA
jgi:hypothetical protein